MNLASVGLHRTHVSQEENEPRQSPGALYRDQSVPRLKAVTQVSLPGEDANPLANDLSFVMDTATVRFIKAGTNRDAAKCVYDWTTADPSEDPLLVLETEVANVPEP